MASITVTATGICAGGNHITFAVTGAKTAAVILDVNDMQGGVPDGDVEAFVRLLCKLAKVGKTNVQLKTALQAGITVSA